MYRSFCNVTVRPTAATSNPTKFDRHRVYFPFEPQLKLLEVTLGGESFINKARLSLRQDFGPHFGHSRCHETLYERTGVKTWSFHIDILSHF